MSGDNTDYIDQMTKETFELVEGGNNGNSSNIFQEYEGHAVPITFHDFFYVLKSEGLQIEFPKNWSFFENITQTLGNSDHFSFFRIAEDTNIDGLYELVFHQFGKENLVVCLNGETMLYSFKEQNEAFEKFYTELKMIAASQMELNKEEELDLAA